MNEPQVTVEKENAFERNWFKRRFYRKDGKKEVIRSKRLQWIFGIVLLIGYTAFLFQPNESTPLGHASPFSVAEAIITSKSIDIPDVVKSLTQGKPPPPSKTHARKSQARTFAGPQLVTRPKIPIPPGFTVKAKLLSGASDGPVRAQLLEPLVVNGETVLDSNPVITGTASSRDERLFVRFDQMVFKDGTIQSITADAYNLEDKTAGLKGSLLGNRTTKIIGSIGLNFVGGMSEGLQDTQVQNGVGFRPSTLKNALLNGASRTAIDESSEMMSSLRNSEPHVHIDSGREFLLSFGGN